MPPGGTGPEQVARQEIDKLLAEAGWIVQSRDEINLSAARGAAIREFKLADGYGFADYLLFVDEHAGGADEVGLDEGAFTLAQGLAFSTSRLVLAELWIVRHGAIFTPLRGLSSLDKQNVDVVAMVNFEGRLHSWSRG